jgi:hypothetical protein
MERSSAISVLIYRACRGLFETDASGQTVPRPRDQVAFLEALETIGVQRSEIDEVLTAIPGPWLDGWTGPDPSDGVAGALAHARANSRAAKRRHEEVEADLIDGEASKTDNRHEIREQDADAE